MIHPQPIVLERDGIRLEPLSYDHRDGLADAAADGELWQLWYTSVPDPPSTQTYIADALKGQEAGHMLPGPSAISPPTPSSAAPAITTSSRRSIAWRSATRWYAMRCQRTNVNTTCKLLLLEYAFDKLGCAVVGLRTDNFNFRSQRAIEALGAKKDGVLRHHQARRDGTVRDSVLYSILKRSGQT